MFECVTLVVRFSMLDDMVQQTPLLRLLHGRHGRPGRVIDSSILLIHDSHLDPRGISPCRVWPYPSRATAASLHGTAPTC
jgi:hypothetical protein